MKKKTAAFFIKLLRVIFLAALAAEIAAADEATLTADAMRYDPDTGMIYASGNVHLTSRNGEVFGDEGQGAVNGRDFGVRGNVRGKLTQADGAVVNITCEEAAVRGINDKDNLVAASGDVKLRRGNENLAADFMSWHTGKDGYSAEGNVAGDFESYFIDADAVSRDADVISARKIRKFHEKTRKITLVAEKADGHIEDETITDMTAEGGVVVTAPDSEGNMTRASGGRGVYSAAAGTLELTVNARVTQQGRDLKSEKITYFIESGNIEAVGKPSLYFETDRK
jgi:lipopolysaccharide transport protein LptA